VNDVLSVPRLTKSKQKKKNTVEANTFWDLTPDPLLEVFAVESLNTSALHLISYMTK